MYGAIKDHLAGQLDEIRKAGPLQERAGAEHAAAPHVGVPGRPDVLNMCANNYLGLADHPEVVKAAHEALDHWGNGMASVRFICGTQEPHKALERAITDFLGTEETILYSSCWDANGGLFETILGPEDAVISDELNHASIIDGIRLCKARRLRYKNNDMADLEAKLKESADARFRLIATDGVFSMDGIIADLKSVCDLADKYDALVMVDDSHAVGFLGKSGRGTHEYRDVMGRVDILTGTLGKALGGASGGYTSASARDRGDAAAAVAAVPVLELGRAGDPGRLAQGDRDLQALDRAARQARGEHEVLPRGDDRAQVQHHPGRAPDHADHDRRRGAGRPDGRAAAGARASTRSASSTRSSPRARPASACRSRPRTAARTWNSRSTPSRPCGMNWGCSFETKRSACGSGRRRRDCPGRIAGPMCSSAAFFIGGPVTTLLQRAVAEVEKLSPEDQDAIAARLLAEVDDERQWNTRFASTTDDQWDRLVAGVRPDVAEGGTLPLDDVFPPDEPE